MPLENLSRLGISMWELKDFEHDGNCEVHITTDGRLVKVEDNDPSQSWKYKATLEILENKLSQIDRKPLADRKLTPGKICFNDIKMLDECLDDECEEFIDHIMPYIQRPSLAEMPDTLREQLNKRDIVDSILDYFALYHMACRIDQKQGTELCEALLPQIKAKTYKCMKLDENFPHKYLEEKYSKCRGMLLHAVSDQNQSTICDCLTTLTMFRETWQAVPQGQWDRTPFDIDILTPKKSTKAQEELQQLAALMEKLNVPEKKEACPQEDRPSVSAVIIEPPEEETRSLSNITIKTKNEAEVAEENTVTEQTDAAGEPEAQSMYRPELKDKVLPSGGLPPYREPPQYTDPLLEERTQLSPKAVKQSTITESANLATTQSIPHIPLGEGYNIVSDQEKSGAKPKTRRAVNVARATSPSTSTLEIVDQKSLDQQLINIFNESADSSMNNRRILEMFCNENVPYQGNEETALRILKSAKEAERAARSGFWQPAELLQLLKEGQSQYTGLSTLYKKLQIMNAFEEGIPPYDNDNNTPYCASHLHPDDSVTYILRSRPEVKPTRFLANVERNQLPLLINNFMNLQLQLYKMLKLFLGDDLTDYYFSNPKNRMRLSPDQKWFYKRLDNCSNLHELTEHLGKITKPSVGHITCWCCPIKEDLNVGKYKTVWAICISQGKDGRRYTLPGIAKDLSAFEIDYFLAGKLPGKLKHNVEEFHKKEGGLKLHKTFRLNFGKICRFRNELNRDYRQLTTQNPPRPVQENPKFERKKRYRNPAKAWPERESEISQALNTSSNKTSVDTAQSQRESLKMKLEKAIPALSKEMRKYKSSGQITTPLTEAIKTLKSLVSQIRDSAELSVDDKSVFQRRSDAVLKNAPEMEASVVVRE